MPPPAEEASAGSVVVIVLAARLLLALLDWLVCQGGFQFDPVAHRIHDGSERPHCSTKFATNFTDGWDSKLSTGEIHTC